MSHATSDSIMTKKFAGRLAGYLYLSTTAISVFLVVGPIDFTYDLPQLAVMLAATLIAGLFGTLAPWDRWRSSASLWLAAYALVLLAISPKFTDLNPITALSFYVLIYVWVGVSHVRLTSLWLTPLAAVSMLVAWKLFGGHDDPNHVMIAATTLASGLLVGESLSYTIAMLVKSEKHEQQRLDTVGMIVDAAEDLASQVSLESVGSYLACFAGGLVDALGARVVLIDVEHNETARFDWGEVGTLENGDVAGSDEVSAELWVKLRAEKSIVVPADASPWWAGVDGVGSVVWAAIKGSGELLGAVGVACRPTPELLPPLVAPTAWSIATQGGLAIERVRARLSLVDQAMRDELTGLGNRRHASSLLAGVSGGDCVMVVDLDHFKNINDAFGHERGDELLKELSSYLMGSLRNADAVARYGGDEFLVVVSGVGERASEVAKRLVEGWRERSSGTTLSVGVAVHESGASANSTFLRADGALYEAKSRGRDQAVVLMPGDFLPTLGSGQQRVSEIEALHNVGH